MKEEEEEETKQVAKTRSEQKQSPKTVRVEGPFL